MDRRAKYMLVGLLLGSALATQAADPLGAMLRDVFSTAFRSNRHDVAQRATLIDAFGLAAPPIMVIAHPIPARGLPEPVQRAD